MQTKRRLRYFYPPGPGSTATASRRVDFGALWQLLWPLGVARDESSREVLGAAVERGVGHPRGLGQLVPPARHS